MFTLALTGSRPERLLWIISRIKMRTTKTVLTIFNDFLSEVLKKRTKINAILEKILQFTMQQFENHFKFKPNPDSK